MTIIGIESSKLHKYTSIRYSISSGKCCSGNVLVDLTGEKDACLSTGKKRNPCGSEGPHDNPRIRGTEIDPSITSSFDFRYSKVELQTIHIRNS